MSTPTEPADRFIIQPVTPDANYNSTGGQGGPKQRAAAGAVIEELTRIGRHRLKLRRAARWTRDDGFRNHDNSSSKLKHVANIGRAGRLRQ
jgi:hypothetical protein